MLVDVNKGHRGTLYDAQGRQVLYAIRADTESGIVEVVKCVRGKFIQDATGTLVTEIVQRPAPLQFIEDCDTPLIITV